MSWSVSAIGKPAAVAAKVKADLAVIRCQEPEETIKNHVGAAIEAGLAAFPANYAVRVEANGSQYAPDYQKPAEVQNQLSVKIEPLGVFLGG